MKNISIKFHSTFLIMALGFVLTGYFVNLLILLNIILVHELGHYIICLIKKYPVKNLTIYPFGGLLKIEEFINRDIDDELLLATMGIIFQSLYFLIIHYLYIHAIVREYIYDIYKIYNYSILVFNILPIYPLDGAKILNLLLSKKLSYKQSNNITIYISLITLLIMMIIGTYKLNYTYILVLITLSINIYTFYKKREYLFYRFLLERYLYNITYNDIKVITKKEKMHKNTTHIIKTAQKYLPEAKFLKKLFDKAHNIW